MIDFIINVINPKTLTMVFAAICAAATVLTLAMPYVFADPLGKRMKAVAIEREKIRERERARLAQERQKIGLRDSSKPLIQTIVDGLNLKKWLAQEQARAKLLQAGYRGQAPYITFLFVRMLMPIALFLFAGFYVFFVLHLQQSTWVKIAICIAAAYLGMHLPMVMLQNRVTRRQLSIKRAFPDMLDLLLICVEAGMSIDLAFRKVSEEVGNHSLPLAEELTVTIAELSYLSDRRQAYDNLAKRTDVDGVKSICMALQQAERYGTSLGSTLRTMAQEFRDMRMSEAEKKAAGLPPKLTVPMILFFLPVLFMVIAGPAAMKLMHILH
jgi:tight adherence protein C